MKSLKTRPQSPWQNCYVERFNLTLKSELLNRTVVADESHVRDLCLQYQNWYNEKRPHQGIDGTIPCKSSLRQEKNVDPENLKIQKAEFLNGLVTHFDLAA